MLTFLDSMLEMPPSATPLPSSPPRPPPFSGKPCVLKTSLPQLAESKKQNKYILLVHYIFCRTPHDKPHEQLLHMSNYPNSMYHYHNIILFFYASLSVVRSTSSTTNRPQQTKTLSVPTPHKKKVMFFLPVARSTTNRPNAFCTHSGIWSLSCARI